jgi:hypothetical protein
MNLTPLTLTSSVKSYHLSAGGGGALFYWSRLDMNMIRINDILNINLILIKPILFSGLLRFFTLAVR